MKFTEPLSDMELQTLGEIASAPLPASPRMVIFGRDTTGQEKHGMLFLEKLLAMPTQRDRVTHVVGLGRYAAGLTPYYPRVDEIHYVHKRTADLSAWGMGSDATVVVIYSATLADNSLNAEILHIQQTNDDTVSFQSIEPEGIELGEEPEQVSQYIQAFLESYTTYAPKDSQ